MHSSIQNVIYVVRYKQDLRVKKSKIDHDLTDVTWSRDFVMHINFENVYFEKTIHSTKFLVRFLKSEHFFSIAMLFSLESPFN